MNDESPFSRLELMFGARGVSRLRAAKVVVLGLGGVGSNCVEALVRGGVGRLVLVDCDVVCPSNLNRQAVAWQSTLGRRKTDVACDLARGINPDVSVEAVDAFLLPDNVEGLIAAHADADFVVDAIDTVAAKLAVAQVCEELGVPLVSSMGAANRLFPERLRFADLYDTSVCPLCRVMRREARKRGIKKLTVLFTDEEPVALSGAGAQGRQGAGDSDAASASDAAMPSGAPSEPSAQAAPAGRREKAPLGTASWFPPIMGQMIAGYVIRSLLGIGDVDSRSGSGRS